MQGVSRNKSPYTPPTSEELIEIYRRSDRPEDFEQIVRRFAALVLSECRRVTANIHDAEDASQLVFLALAIEIKSGTSIRHLGAWLQRVAHRQALKIVRSRGRRQRREDAVRRNELEHSDVASPIDSAIQAGIVRDAIDQLPERYRLPVILHYFGGMSLERIAVELKLKRSAVGTRLHRGRKMLAARLSKQGVEMQNGTLASALSVIVPATVVGSIVRAARHIAAPEAVTATMPLAAGNLLRAVTLVAIRKPLRAAAIAAALASGGTGLGWIVSSHHLNFDRLRNIEAIEWLKRFFHVRPPVLLSDQTPARADVPNVSVPELDRVIPESPRVEWHPPLVPAVERYFIPPVRAARLSPSPGTPGEGRGEGPRVAVAMSELSTLNQSFALAPRRSHPVAIDPPRINPPAPPRAPVVLGPVALGVHRGDDEEIRLGPGEFRAPSIAVGVAGHAKLVLDHTKVTTGKLTLGVEKSGSGEVVQKGGEVTASTVFVGDAGRGVYTINYGRLSVDHLTIAAQSLSFGRFQLVGGEVVMTNSANTVSLDSNTSYLTTNTVTSSYSASTTPVSVLVGGAFDAQATVQGWGIVNTGGTLINNGRIVANGFDQVRVLNLSGFTSVSNTIDNPVGGNTGWFVERGGRIALPPFSIAPGTNTYTWGENPDDPTPDLVNSLRIKVHDQPKPATLAVTLRSIANADPLDIMLPADMKMIGLWQFNGVNLDPSQIDILVRYDDAAAKLYSSGEENLELLAYDGEWQLADAMSRDTVNKWISGSFDGNFTYLAVGVPLPQLNSIFAQATLSELSATSIVPEPAGICVIVTALAGLFARRTRRR